MSQVERNNLSLITSLLPRTNDDDRFEASTRIFLQFERANNTSMYIYFIIGFFNSEIYLLWIKTFFGKSNWDKFFNILADISKVFFLHDLVWRVGSTIWHTRNRVWYCDFSLRNSKEVLILHSYPDRDHDCFCNHVVDESQTKTNLNSEERNSNIRENVVQRHLCSENIEEWEETHGSKEVDNLPWFNAWDNLHLTSGVAHGQRSEDESEQIESSWN